MKRISFVAAAFAILSTAPLNLFAAASPQKPNVIFVLVDDIDLGCYGATLVKTLRVA